MGKKPKTDLAKRGNSLEGVAPSTDKGVGKRVRLWIFSCLLLGALIVFSTRGVTNGSHLKKADQTWAWVYGQEGEDDKLSSIRPTRDGGFIAVGSIVDRKIEEPGLRDAWALKLRADGSVEWQHAYKMKGLSPLRPDRYFIDEFSDVIETPDGDFIATGLTEQMYPWLMKMGSNGRVKWLKMFESHHYSGLGSITPTSDGDYLAVGSLNGREGEPHFRGSVWLLRFDSEGKIVWNKAYVGFQNPYGRQVFQLADGSILITAGIDATMDGQRWGLWLLKLRKGGTTEWSRFYSGLGVSGAKAVYDANQDTITLFAIRDVPETEPELKYLGRTRGQRIALRLDPQGNILWTKTHDSSDRTKFRPWAREAISMSDGGILLVGSAMQNVLRTDSHGKTFPDVGWLAELDPEKGFLRSRVFRLGDTTTLLSAHADQRGIAVLGRSDIMEGALVLRLDNDLSFSTPCEMDVQGLPEMTVSEIPPLDLKPKSVDAQVLELKDQGQVKDVSVFELDITARKVCD